VQSQSETAHYSLGRICYSQHRATIAISTLSYRSRNSSSRRRREIRWKAIEVRGQEIEAKQGRNSAKSGIRYRIERPHEDNVEESSKLQVLMQIIGSLHSST